MRTPSPKAMARMQVAMRAKCEQHNGQPSRLFAYLDPIKVGRVSCCRPSADDGRAGRVPVDGPIAVKRETRKNGLNLKTNGPPANGATRTGTRFTWADSAAAGCGRRRLHSKVGGRLKRSSRSVVLVTGEMGLTLALIRRSCSGAADRR